MADQVRSLAGPNGLDVRVHQLTIRLRTWSGARKGAGTPTDVDLVLAQQYPIRPLKAQEIAGSGGEYELGDILVDHITPSNGTIGFTPQQLKPPTPLGDRQERIYIIGGSPGPHAGEYSLIEIRTYRPFTYQLILRRRTTTP